MNRIAFVTYQSPPQDTSATQEVDGKATPRANPPEAETRVLPALTAVCFVFSSLCLGAGKESALTRHTLPVNPEADAQLTLDELPGLVSFTRQLAAGEPGTIEARLYGLFNPTLRESLMRWEFEEDYPESLKIETVKMLNRILRRTDLYDEKLFADTSLGDQTRSDYGDSYAVLGPVDKARVNRRMLHEVFPDAVTAPRTPNFPERPKRLHVAGDEFLSSGDLQKGVKIPTGAVWQPNVFFFGEVRTAGQYFDSGDADGYMEAVARLDLNLNVALTPTERLVVGFRPLDDGRNFTGYQSEDTASREEGFKEELDLEPETLFFAGDIGELIPALDPSDSAAWDIGFSVGRQPIRFQNGFLIDDNIDALGIVKNNLTPLGASNLRLTGLFAWNELDRSGAEDRNAVLLGLFTAMDFPKTTVEFDVAAVVSDIEMASTSNDVGEVETSRSGGESLHAGIGFIQRIGLWNTSFRVNASVADEDSESVGDGVLLFTDASYTLPHSEDLVYATAFAAFDDYTAAARRPTAQGPLAPAGILFEGTGIGSVGSALSNLSQDVAGGAIGWQTFSADRRSNVTLEIGGRIGLDEIIADAIGLGLRWQKALGQRWILRADAAISYSDEEDPRSVVSAGVSYRF